MTQPNKKTIHNVLLVGHCGFDSGSLTHLVSQAMGVNAQRVNSDAQLDKQAGPHTLLLINRVLDGDFKAGDGVQLVEQLAAKGDAPAMMVITNYPDVQKKAKAAGALQGFGKNDIGDAALVQRLKKLVSE